MVELKKKFNHFSDHPVFFKWFVSYLVMLGLTLIASIAIYFYSYRIIDQQQEKVNKVMLEKIESEVEYYFNTARSTVSGLILDSDIDRVSRSHSFDVEDHEKIYYSYEKIANKRLSYEFIDHIFIYFLRSDSVLFDEGHVDKELFYELYYKADDTTPESFDELMRQRWIGDFVKIKDNQNRDTLAYLWNSYPRGEDIPKATIGVSISCESIKRIMDELKWNEATQVILLDEDGILCSNGILGELMLEKHPIGDTKFQSLEEIEIDGENYRLTINSTAEEAENEYTFIALTPVNSLEKEAKKIQMFTLLLLLISTTLGIFTAYFMSGRNYDPLRQVLDACGGYKAVNEYGNEYQWLMGRTAQYLSENKRVKKKVYENEKVLRHQYIYRLIAFPYDEKLLKEEGMPKDKILEKSNYLVVLLHTSYISEQAVDEEEIDRNLLRFVLVNILEELCDSKIAIEVADMTDCFAVIVNSDYNAADLREKLEDMLDMMQIFSAEKLLMNITAFFGGIQNDVSGINQSYVLAREAAEYKNLMAGESFVWYDDIRNRHTLYQYSSETEQKIIYAINNGQSDLAMKWLNEVIDVNYHKRELPYTMKKCLVAELLGTVVKGAEQGGSADYILRYMEEKPLPEAHYEYRIREYFNTLVSKLCDDIVGKEKKNRDNKQFSVKVMKYVQENYHNPDLNISITALHFGITPSYLSSLFKEQTGLNLLEYINRTRVEAVKGLLLKDQSLGEICEQTGFRNSGALIRVFKKITGVTPGQMKNILEEEA